MVVRASGRVVVRTAQDRAGADGSSALATQASLYAAPAEGVSGAVCKVQ